MPADKTFLSDEQLWDLVSRGHNDAFESLYVKYWASLLDSAYKRLKVKEDAEEIVQEVFADLYIRRYSIIIEHSLAAYLYRAVQFGVFKKIRTCMQERKYKQKAQAPMPEATESMTARSDYKELAHTLQLAINQLPEKCREVFLLSRERGLTHYEIAQKVNISQSTVEKHISKAVKTLRKFVILILILSEMIPRL